MQKRKRKPPTYRQRKGYDQAIVTLTDKWRRELAGMNLREERPVELDENDLPRLFAFFW